MSAYEKAGESDEWYTPRWVFNEIGEKFDLDVASPPTGPRFTPCSSWYSSHDDALARDWWGFVWMNPPFGRQSTKITWLSRFFEHGNGIALLPDRTSAPWWQHAAAKASCILFTNGKIKFCRPDGSLGESPGTGTTLFAAGDRAKLALTRSTGLGSAFIASTNGRTS